jgi:hypothetical protein
MLREVSKGLDMDTSKILPTEEELRVQQALQQRQEMLAVAAGAAQAGMPTENIQIERDANGTMTGAKVMPNAPQNLATGAPVSNSFQPQRGA